MLLRQALSQERTAHGDELLLPGAPTREQIVRFEELLLQPRRRATASSSARGTTSPTASWRTILIPAGTVLTGAAAQAEHLNIAVGDITVWTDMACAG